jgi:hypothetical protein
MNWKRHDVIATIVSEFSTTLSYYDLAQTNVANTIFAVGELLPLFIDESFRKLGQAHNIVYLLVGNNQIGCLLVEVK